MAQPKRCDWCGDDPLYQHYHDHEWGVPVYDDQTLFEFITLEGAQAGLSWITILKKREGYRKAFANFEVEKVARFSDQKLEKLLLNPGIVRNRLKVFSTRKNAKAFINIQKEFDSFSDYIWGFVDGKPIQNKWKSISEIPVTSPESDTISKDLKKRGFSFVGSTIIYAYMQATGMVNDHISSCSYRGYK
ncbi:MAG: DNA-3-methyladenine glycosylase I [Oceanicoccus sp.]|uniref:DNA-3-methyladenine glycosylase I n=1 Tax=Oceanicoccus sp. TaxID=2691044 RepID=UPI002637D9AC|nr:DNA-3-methyladenine glycosylase I [Oceanicoccus sp.]MCP3908653.1 DNA-3-methyladenine glycosylase I [Oceanicoccus sp.]MDG1772779.1 DNA-3-methyladenine glycosylase I [Oceanicoccus sp.]